MVITITVEPQFYGESAQERDEYAKYLTDVILRVVRLSDYAVGTFVKTDITKD